MIDTQRVGFLDSSHFDDRKGGGKHLRPAVWLFGLALLVLPGCSSQPRTRAVEDSLTSGRISIVTAAEAEPVLRREVDAFQKLYSEARLSTTRSSSREAIGALFGAEADVAVITRELETEERAAAVRGGLELEGFRFAGDAVVVIVDAANPVENLALDDLRAIYEGTLTDWSRLGGATQKVVPVVQTPESDVTGFFVQRVMGGEPIRAAAHYAADDEEVVRRVQTTPGAIGFVTLAALRDGVRDLRLAPLKGISYWRPDLEAVYRGQYPLTRYFHLYVRTKGARLAHGFITFVTSREGQQLVQDSGLVPTSVPVRFVRRSPMLSTH